MGALFGLLTSLSVTTSEMFGRQVSNQDGPVVAAASASFFATLTGLVVALVAGGDPTGTDWVLGAGAGVLFGGGMVAYLQGVRIASSAVVSPTVAALTALIPFIYTAIVHDVPSALAVAGALVAVVGLLLVTMGGATADNTRGGLLYGAMSGVGYGGGAVLLIETSNDAGTWPAFALRAVSVLMIVMLAIVRRRPVIPGAGLRAKSAVSGAMSGASSILLLVGLQANPAAAAVTGSLFPATSVAGGRIVFGDSVTATQVVGLITVIAGVVGVVGG